MIGTNLAHYRITGSLGSGGMGDVYRAEDAKLGRQVAIKVLPAEMAADAACLERFQREARAVAALNHPNIVTIFSVEEAAGHHFLTMELVDGQTLAKEIPQAGLPLERFFGISTALATALEAAHSQGITHRDLKPANVMLTSDGRVKVLDFGLAKLTETVGNQELTQMPTEALTQEGVVMGTIPYMSPEQVEGRRLDHRTDIFSLGVLYYEMLTGQRPFQGDTQPGLMSSILRDVPPSVVDIRTDLPRHLGRILQRCLEKDPQDRFESARSLAYELEGLRNESLADLPAQPISATAAFGPGPRNSSDSPAESSSGTGPASVILEKSIAVLPFLNRSANPDDQYFSDGLSEELINALSRLPGVRVTARSSAFQFRGQELDVREVGKKLGVEAVLEGSVRISGQRLRITTELVNCADGYQLWSERFDAEMRDIFDTQDEIVQAIVKEFEVEVASDVDVTPAKKEVKDLAAYHLVLKARHHMADFWEPGVVKAIECLEQAIELDPEYALAHAEMSGAFLIQSIFGSLSGAEAFPQVRAHAVRALELDPDLSDAHRMHGIFLAWHDLDWESGERELRRALELGPQNVWNHFYYAAVLSTLRRGDEIVPHAWKLAELDPLNPIVNGHVGLFLFYAGQTEEAIGEARKTMDLFPDFYFGYYGLSYFLWQQGDYEGAVEHLSRAIELTGGKVGFIISLLAAMHFSAGNDAEGERCLARSAALSETSFVSVFGDTVVEVVRGNTDAAIALMERARAEHETLFAWTRAFCELQGIIKDERLREAMERLGLP